MYTLTTGRSFPWQFSPDHLLWMIWDISEEKKSPCRTRERWSKLSWELFDLSHHEKSYARVPGHSGRTLWWCTYRSGSIRRPWWPGLSTSYTGRACDSFLGLEYLSAQSFPLEGLCIQWSRKGRWWQWWRKRGTCQDWKECANSFFLVSSIEEWYMVPLLYISVSICIKM